MAERYECHVAPIVDVGQSSNHVVTRSNLTEKSIPPRGRRQPFNERALERGIFLANRTDQHPSAIAERLMPVPHRIEVDYGFAAWFGKPCYMAWWRRIAGDSHCVLLFDQIKPSLGNMGALVLTEVKRRSFAGELFPLLRTQSSWAYRVKEHIGAPT
jgi:hypothetical protein